MNRITKISIIFVVTLIYAIVTWMIFSPTVSLHYPSFWIWSASCFFVFGFGLIAITNKYFGNYLFAYLSFGLGLFLLLLCAGSYVLSLPVLNKDEYASLTKVESNTKENYSMGAADLSWMPKEQAKALVAEKLSKNISSESDYYLADGTLGLFQGDPIYIFSLESKSGKQNTLGFAYISLTSEVVTVQSEDGPFIYSPYRTDESNIKKLLKKEFSSVKIGESHLEIDDDGKPYWITFGYKPTISFMGGMDVAKIFVTNPYTGSTTEYSKENVPDWIDYVCSIETVIEQYNTNAKLQSWGYSLHDTYLLMPRSSQIYAVANIHLEDEKDAGVAFINITTGQIKQYSIGSVCSELAFNRFDQVSDGTGYLTNTIPLAILDQDNVVYATPLYSEDKGVEQMLVVDGVEANSYGMDKTLDEAIDSLNGLSAGSDEFNQEQNEPQSQSAIENEEGITTSVINGLVNTIKEENDMYVITFQYMNPEFYIDKTLITMDELIAGKTNNGITLVYPIQYNGSVQDAYGGTEKIFDCVPGSLDLN